MGTYGPNGEVYNLIAVKLIRGCSNTPTCDCTNTFRHIGSSTRNPKANTECLQKLGLCFPDNEGEETLLLLFF